MAREAVIVDDHSGFRRQARWLLEQVGYRVVGEAASGSEALSKVRQLKPDLVMLDIQLPDLDGFDVLITQSTSDQPTVSTTFDVDVTLEGPTGQRRTTLS